MSPDTSRPVRGRNPHPNHSRVFLAVGALVVAIALAGAGPAQADPPSGQITTPVDGHQFGEAAEVVVGARFDAPSGAPVTWQITQVALSVSSDRGPGSQTRVWDNLDQRSFAETWNTFDSGLFDYNGRYVVSATASSRDCGVCPTETTNPPITRSFYLAVPPVQPTGVTATFNEAKRTVAVSWTGNPEPDLLGYVVQRAKEGGAPKPLAEVEPGETSYTDDAGDLEGSYSYSVVALREGAEDVNADPTKSYEALNSAPSKAATASIPSRPTTTTNSTTAGGGGAAGQEPGSTTSTSEQQALANQGRVDMSGFAALLDQARAQARPAPRATIPDEGYTDELPYGARPPGTTARPRTAGDSDVGIALADDDEELGGDDRMRSMAFLAGGLFAFVLLMHLVWIRSEVRHVPLDAADPGGDEDARDENGDDSGDDAPGGDRVDGAVTAGPAANGRRPARRSRTGTLPTQATPTPVPTATRRKGSQGARGAPHRVPSRSRGDRREGRPAVRAGR